MKQSSQAIIFLALEVKSVMNYLPKPEIESAEEIPGFFLINMDDRVDGASRSFLLVPLGVCGWFYKL